MSQPDAKVTLNRLKQTISQLQQVVERLEAQQGTLPPEALDSLAQDVATLSSQVRSSPPASQAKSREDVSFEPATPETKTTVPPQTPSQAVPSRRVQTPSLMQRLSELLRQRRFVGILLGAIAVVFIWQFALGTPRTSPDMSQTEPADQLEQVDEQPPISQPSAPVQKAPTPVTPAPKVAEPAPPKPLTPEQRLIAAIQEQIETVTQPYGDNIVRAIRPDFRQSSLNITVGDAWYLLKPNLQDRLGTEVLELSHLLDFRKLSVEDLDGNFVARNPVVGKQLVIVRRYQTLDNL